MAEVDALAEGPHAGGFIVSEASGHRSRDEGILTDAEGLLEAGAVMDLETGEWVEHVPATGVAAGILIWSADSTAEAKPIAVMVRDAEVNGSEIVWPTGISAPNIALAVAELALVGIIVRDAV